MLGGSVVIRYAEYPTEADGISASVSLSSGFKPGRAALETNGWAYGHSGIVKS